MSKVKTNVNELAAKLVQFSEDFDTYNFMDNAEGTREEMVEQMASDLLNEDFANGVKEAFDEWAEDDIADDMVDDFNSMRSEITQYVEELGEMSKSHASPEVVRERAMKAEARFGDVGKDNEAQSEMEVE